MIQSALTCIAVLAAVAYMAWQWMPAEWRQRMPAKLLRGKGPQRPAPIALNACGACSTCGACGTRATRSFPA